MAVASGDELEPQFAEWRAYMRRRRAMGDTEIDELEDHLRATVAELAGVGLRPQECFLVAVTRMGSREALSRPSARAYTQRLWKQLVVAGAPQEAAAGSRRDLLTAVGCAAAAAVCVKAPALFGAGFDGAGYFYQRNFALFALAPLAAYIAIRRRVSATVAGTLAALFVLGATAANAYPVAADSQSIVLTTIHLPLALWLVLGIGYVSGDWRSQPRWMDFVRFSGEWFIYYVLIALGGGVLIGMTVGVFDAIRIDAGNFLVEWMLPCGAVAGVVIAAWLVDAKQGVIESMAPVLTRVFTPLFTATLLVFLGAVLWTRSVIDVERDVLIVFDLLLAVVLGLLLYGISARDPGARPGLFDWLQFALAVSALVIDALVLAAITGRITEWGATPNKAAALGENLILLGNLAWTALLIAGFVRGRRPFQQVERWQTRYLAVYAAWVWAVVLVFPPVFGFA